MILFDTQAQISNTLTHQNQVLSKKGTPLYLHENGLLKGEFETYISGGGLPKKHFPYRCG
jgi:hypothetical protein